MIVEAIFNLIRAIIGFIEDELPDWTPVELTDHADSLILAFDRAFDFVAWANLYAPVDEAIIVLGLMIAFHLGALMTNGIVWILSKLHIAGGGSN